MGNIFYYLLTDNEPFAELRKVENSDAIKQMIIDGKIPELSEEIKVKSSNPSVLALIKAMSMCHVHDYRRRARAQTVRDFLAQELKKITSVPTN
jgi:hypothetical protein